MARRTAESLTSRFVSGQLDIFGQPTEEPAPTPSSRRIPRQLAPGEVKWTATHAGRNCDDCWSAQEAANRAGLPVPARQPVRWRLNTDTDVMHLCSSHASARGQGTRTERPAGRSRKLKDGTR